jgi:ribosomal protein S18 acetylase RimI-like enzyme
VLGYHIRPATGDDVGFLADVVIEATRAQGRLADDFDEPQWRTAFSKWTLEHVGGQEEASTTSVIEVQNERAGRLRVTRTGDYIELSGIQLLPGVQGRGIGSSIIAELKAQAAAAGLPLELAVEKDNPDARRLYERLGFLQVAETGDEARLRWQPRPDADQLSLPAG